MILQVSQSAHQDTVEAQAISSGIPIKITSNVQCKSQYCEIATYFKNIATPNN